ncbi:MAG: deoxyribonuclease V [Thermodesulfobacteriota bacterium]|nr:deoxyribonuclease V [Thermodesulfobacteriota bacterium]
MVVRELNSWSVSPSEALNIQETLKKKLVLKKIKKNIHLLAGADVSYSKKNRKLYAAVTVMTFPELNEVEEATAGGDIHFPYIPGLLSFREAPILARAFKKIRRVPDVVIFDGQGIAHPRGMGLATHMGLMLDVPSIGCAKSRLFGTYEKIGNTAGDFSFLKADGMIVGVALRTRTNIHPIFVSPGYKTDIPGCIETIINTCRGYRIPEPIRQAHLLANQRRMKEL